MLAYLLLAGCGKPSLEKVVHGSVTCGNEKVPCGMVSFVPMPGTSGPTSTGLIVDGQYRIEARGGVPFGKHRVQVDAKKPTGRKIQGSNGLEITMIDEQVRMGAEIYVGDQSPLIADIQGDCNGRFDITIPPVAPNTTRR